MWFEKNQEKRLKLGKLENQIRYPKEKSQAENIKGFKLDER